MIQHLESGLGRAPFLLGLNVIQELCVCALAHACFYWHGEIDIAAVMSCHCNS